MFEILVLSLCANLAMWVITGPQIFQGSMMVLACRWECHTALQHTCSSSLFSGLTVTLLVLLDCWESLFTRLALVSNLWKISVSRCAVDQNLMCFRFMLMAPQRCPLMKEKQALENFMVIPAFHDTLFCYYATGMVSVYFHLMRHIWNFSYLHLLYFYSWWPDKFVDIVYVSVSYHLSILTATPEGCNWCGRQKAKSGMFRKIQKKRWGWTTVFRYWHWKRRRMWNLHGDEQQDSLAQLQSCNVHEMLPRLVFLLFSKTLCMGQKKILSISKWDTRARLFHLILYSWSFCMLCYSCMYVYMGEEGSADVWTFLIHVANM